MLEKMPTSQSSEQIIDKELEERKAQERKAQAEAVREISDSREAALAEYYEGDPDAASKRQQEINDLLEQSLEGSLEAEVYVAIGENDDDKLVLRHPDEVTEPGHCTPNRVHALSNMVYFTDAYGRVRTLRLEDADQANEKVKELTQRGFTQSDFGDRRNQVLVTDNMWRGNLVRVDTTEFNNGRYPQTKDAVYEASKYPRIGVNGKVYYSIIDEDGFAISWNDPNASWNS